MAMLKKARRARGRSGGGAALREEEPRRRRPSTSTRPPASSTSRRRASTRPDQRRCAEGEVRRRASTARAPAASRATRPADPGPVTPDPDRGRRRACQDAHRAVRGRPDRAPRTAGNRARGHEPGARSSTGGPTVSVPQPWTPESVATPEQVVAGLHATDEGGADLVQLLTPEGERVPDERFDGYAADVGVAGAARPVPGHGAGPPVRPGGQRPAAAGPAQHLGAAARPGGRPDRRRPGDAHRRTWPSRPTASTASPGAAGSTRRSCSGIFRGTDQCGWDPKATRFNSYTIVIGNQVLNATGYAMGQRFDGVEGRATGPTADGHRRGDHRVLRRRRHQPGRRARGHGLRRGLRRAGRLLLPEQPVGDLRAGRPGSPGCRCGNGRPATASPASGWTATTCWPAWPSPAGRWRSAASGNGPVMIEAFTYRMDAHTTSDDPTRYRMAAEEEHWKLLDPIERVKAHLVRQGLADQEFFDGVGGRGRRAGRAVPGVLHRDARSRRRSGFSPTSTPSRTTSSRQQQREYLRVPGRRSPTQAARDERWPRARPPWPRR